MSSHLPPGPPSQPPTGPTGPYPTGAGVPTGPYPTGAYPPAGGPPGPPGSPGAAPTTSAPAAGAPRRRGPVRIFGRALLVLLIVGALGGALAWGFANRSSAEKWQARSERADANLRRSLDRIEDTTVELEAANERARELANEKAGETDLNRILSEVVNQAPEVTDDLAECQRLTTELANDLIAATNDPNVDRVALQERIDDVNQICADALQAAEDLEETIDALDVE